MVNTFARPWARLAARRAGSLAEGCGPIPVCSAGCVDKGSEREGEERSAENVCELHIEESYLSRCLNGIG